MAQKETLEALPPARDATIIYRGSSYKIPTLAIMLMLAAILAPTVMYSINLRDPTPAELLVAICIGLFSSVLALWILDITSVLPFRAGWVSKSIWGVAIVSILGTSVGVYKNTFSERLYPYEGLWELSVWRGLDGELLDRREVILMFSTSAETYWGFSDARGIEKQPRNTAPVHGESDPNANRRILWVEIVRLDTKNQELEMRIHDQHTEESIRIDKLNISSHRTRISGASGVPQTVGSYHMVLARPK